MTGAGQRRSIAVYGAGGMGKEVMELADLIYAGHDVGLVFVDDSLANGTTILSLEEFLWGGVSDKTVLIAISNSAARARVAERCLESGLRPASLRAPNALVFDSAEIGEGAILCAFTHITSSVTIGRYFHANYYAYVAHDCRIGDFVTFAPGAKCNGNVWIDDHAYIGSGAVLRQGSKDRPLRIGRGAVVGMGAVVTRDVKPGETVVGNPARPLIR